MLVATGERSTVINHRPPPGAKPTGWQSGGLCVIFSTVMEHRKTPPVLRRTKPELLADEQRSRRGRRQRLGLGLLGGGALIATLSAAVAWSHGFAADTGVGLALGLASAAFGVWALRPSTDGRT
jgi:hypothetical protein